MRCTILAFICVLLISAAQLSLKLGADAARAHSSGGSKDFLVAALTNWVVLGGFVLYGLSAVLWLFVLARVELSYAYPFVSLGFVLMSVAGAFLLGETLGPLRVAGTALICLGVIAVARS